MLIRMLNKAFRTKKVALMFDRTVSFWVFKIKWKTNKKWNTETLFGRKKSGPGYTKFLSFRSSSWFRTTPRPPAPKRQLVSPVPSAFWVQPMTKSLPLKTCSFIEGNILPKITGAEDCAPGRRRGSGMTGAQKSHVGIDIRRNGLEWNRV